MARPLIRNHVSNQPDNSPQRKRPGRTPSAPREDREHLKAIPATGTHRAARSACGCGLRGSISARRSVCDSGVFRAPDVFAPRTASLISTSKIHAFADLGAMLGCLRL